MRFISKLGASNSSGVGIIAGEREREGGGGETRAQLPWWCNPILRSVCNFAPGSGGEWEGGEGAQQAARPKDQLWDESSSWNSLYLFCFLPPPPPPLSLPLSFSLPISCSLPKKFRNSDRWNSCLRRCPRSLPFHC